MLYYGFGFISEVKINIASIIRYYIPNIKIYRVNETQYFIGNIYNVGSEGYLETNDVPRDLELPRILPGTHAPARLKEETNTFLKDLFQQTPMTYAFHEYDSSFEEYAY